MMFVVDLQFNDKKMRAVIPALLFCAVLARYFFSVIFLGGLIEDDVLCGCI